MVNSPEKTQRLIACWKIVDQHLIRATGKQKHIYVEAAKKIIYNRVKEHFPNIIENNAAFFNLKPSLFKRIFKIK